MKAVSRVVGTLLPLDRPDIDTDQIIPQQFLKRIERDGYGEFLFYNWGHDDHGRPRPDFVLNDPARRGARILVAGPNFGCGSSREHAAWGIQDWGFDAVVAPSIADIFKANAVNIGLLPVEMAREDVGHLIEVAGDPVAGVTIDLSDQTVTTTTKTLSFAIDATSKQRLIGGIDRIAETLGHVEAIAGHEQTRPRWLPVTTAGGRD